MNKVKEMLSKIESELKKLDSIEDPKVKEIYSSVSKLVTDIMPFVEKNEDEVNKLEEKIEEIKDGSKESKTEESSKEDSSETKSKSEIKEEKVEEESKNGKENDTKDETSSETSLQHSEVKAELSAESHDSESIELAKWDTAYINTLPNSSFVIIEPDYLEGKTQDKNARHLPYKDESGKVDLAHLRNACARVNQLKAVTKSISTEELVAKATKKLETLKKKYMEDHSPMAELNAEVSDKLKEAALELNKFELTIKSKDEIISIQQNKILELEKALNVYHEAEKLELAKKFESKVNKLSELYSSLGMKKSVIELKSSFSEEQIDKLIIDLSAINVQKPQVQNNVVIESKPKRLTTIQADLELASTPVKKNTELNAEENAKYIVSTFF